MHQSNNPLKDKVAQLQGFKLKVIYKSFGFWKGSEPAKVFPELIVNTTIEEAIEELFR